MARPLGIEYPGALNQVTSRGNARGDIVAGDADRRLFAEVLGAAVERHGWLCHAWCLMDNHYHLLVETPTANLSKGMRQLNGIHTQRVNRRRGRVGHVFQGRYKAILVEREAHLLELCRYVVLNPVRAGLRQRVADCRWISYRATAGLAPKRTFEQIAWPLGQFDAEADAERARAAYRRFVARGRRAGSPWEGLAGDHVLGGEAFRARLAAVARRSDPEVPRRARPPARESLDALRARWPERGEWMARAYREHGYTHSAIAETVGPHYSSVSKIVKAWEAGRNSRFKT